jgi:hypothetical protein
MTAMRDWELTLDADRMTTPPPQPSSADLPDLRVRLPIDTALEPERHTVTPAESPLLHLHKRVSPMCPSSRPLRTRSIRAARSLLSRRPHRHCAGALTRPRRVACHGLRFRNRLLASVSPVERLTTALDDGRFSQLPVYSTGTFVGLLTAETVMRWVAAGLTEDIGLAPDPVHRTLGW